MLAFWPSIVHRTTLSFPIGTLLNIDVQTNTHTHMCMLGIKGLMCVWERERESISCPWRTRPKCRRARIKITKSSTRLFFFAERWADEPNINRTAWELEDVTRDTRGHNRNLLVRHVEGLLSGEPGTLFMTITNAFEWSKAALRRTVVLVFVSICNTYHIG